jgi:hypothetical protein
MAAIAISESALAHLKKALRNDFVDEKSSHLSEALATALGFKTHASLLAAVSKEVDDPPIVLLNTERFVERLTDFGYLKDTEFDFEFLTGQVPPVISTIPDTAAENVYDSSRKKAWRNLMVFTINEGLRRKLFSLRSHDNRWPGAVSAELQTGGGGRSDEGVFFNFDLPNGFPVRAIVSDVGWGELSIHAAVNPVGDWVRAGNAGFEAGDAVAKTWLERERGAWMQSATTLFNCRRCLVQALAEVQVEPMGFGDKGNVIM